MRLFLFTLLLLFLAACDKRFTPEQQLQADISAIENYLSDRNLVATATPSGLHYIVDVAGSGGNPQSNSSVTVHYVGKLLKNGNVFDQTADVPRTFLLNTLIEGWQEGIPLLKKGGKGTFFVPSALGYGPFGSGSIPGNAPLIFEIELVDFQ